MKQALLSLCALVIAIGIYACMVVYTVKVIRTYERNMLFGTGITSQTEKSTAP